MLLIKKRNFDVNTKAVSATASVAMIGIIHYSENDNEFKFVSSLLKKLGVGASSLSKDELEDIGMSKLLRSVDRTKKATRSEIMRKLTV